MKLSIYKYQTIIIALLLLVFSICGCSNRKKQYHRSDYNLIGNVKSIRETSFNATERFGDVEKGGICSWPYPFYTIFKQDGYIMENKLYETDGSLASIEFFEYDKESYVVTKNECASDGSLFRKWIYQFDKEGREIEQYCYSYDGKLDFRWILKHDDKDKRVEYNMYNPDGSLANRWTRVHDKKGYLIEIVNNLEHTLVSIALFKNDDKGNIVEEKIIFREIDELQIKTFEYDFDKRGNWIKRVEHLNGTLNQITEREIEYFN